MFSGPESNENFPAKNALFISSLFPSSLFYPRDPPIFLPFHQRLSSHFSRRPRKLPPLQPVLGAFVPTHPPFLVRFCMHSVPT